jgi:imidazolonepropionase-like amidohydrolase
MTIAITCRLLIEGTGNPPIQDGVVLIRDKEIIDIGPRTKTKIPTNCEIINCAEDTILPGLIDTHSHIIFCGSSPRKKKTEFLTTQQKQSLVLKYILAYRNILDDMSAGVTTIRSLGSDDNSDITIRDAIHAGILPGPRLISSGIPIRPSHGTAAFLARPADGVEEVCKAVRGCIKDGADVIKVFATNIQSGEGEIAYRLGDLTRTAGYTKGELEAIVDEAHNAGIKVAAHALGGPSLRWAMEAGVDSVEHVNLMEEQDIEVFLKTHCVLSDPNLFLFFDKEYGFESRKNWNQLPDWWRQKVAYAREQTRIYHKKAYEAGVRFTLALDSSHGLIWREAKCMVEVLGASPMDTILSLTKYSAELCGLDNVGILQVGKSADLISVKGNPLEDISHLQNVRLIMKEGKRYDTILHKFRDLENSAEDFLISDL